MTNERLDGSGRVCGACGHEHQLGRVTCGYLIRKDPHYGEISCVCAAEPTPAEQPRKQCGCMHGDSDPYCPDPLCPNYVAAYHEKMAMAASPAEGPRQNRYWDISTADGGGRLLRICWHKNDAGNFMAMEVAEFVTWNNAADQEDAEDFILKALNGIEQSRVWLAKRADGEDKTFLTNHAAQPSPDAAKVQETLDTFLLRHFGTNEPQSRTGESLREVLRPYFPADAAEVRELRADVTRLETLTGQLERIIIEKDKSYLEEIKLADANEKRAEAAEARLKTVRDALRQAIDDQRQIRTGGGPIYCRSCGEQWPGHNKELNHVPCQVIAWEAALSGTAQSIGNGRGGR